jgi:predicted metal-dependent hydrolase
VTDRGQVTFGDTTIEYEVRRSRRRKKTVEISLNGGGVRVAVPWKMSNDEVRDIVLKRAPWILKHMAEEQDATPARRFVSGETLSYMGRNVSLVVEPADVRSTVVRFDHWRFLVSVPHDMVADDRNEAIHRGIVEWYRARAMARLSEYVDRWWGRLGRGIKSRILIGDQKRRWGSCAADGTLRFNWRVMMLEPSLIEYVVVHELAHLTHLNHSADYWGLVASVMPDVNQRRQRIREAGQTLPL